MAKYVLIGDIHASDRPPSSCTDRYLTDLLEMLAEVNRLAKSEQASGIVWAGDVFHHKSPSRTSHRLVMAMLRLIAAAPCAVYIVPGNHDMQYDSLDSVSITQPLGVLLHSGRSYGGATLLESWDGDDFGDGRPGILYGVPWQQQWTDEKVRDALADYRNATLDGRGNKPNVLVVTHAPLYPPGSELTYENYPAAKFAEAMGNSGHVYYGHVHEPHGSYYVDGVWFCNNGALSRGSLHEYNLTRQVCATVWDTHTGGFEAVPLMMAPPASEVFRLQEKQEATDIQGRLDDFLASVSSATLEVVSIESVVQHVKGMGLDRPVEALIEELIEEAAHER